MDYQKIIDFYYPQDTELKRLLLKHSAQVRDKALAILTPELERQFHIDRETVETGAMLHDIGIFLCDAPGILCTGTEHYIRHGLLGARLLREYGAANNIDLEKFARICERHTGSGLTAEEIRTEQLPLPEQDFLPETYEEKLICLADKFFSKSGKMKEKSFEKVFASMEKFGKTPQDRFVDLCRLFKVTGLE